MSTTTPATIVPHGAYVAVDTQALIWGGIRRGIPGIGGLSPADAEKEKRSRFLMHDLDEAKAQIVIPSIVVAELLLPIDPQHHGTFLAVMTQRFRCPPFDLPATSLAASLWQYGHSLPAQEQGKRTVLKADVMIVATAKVHGVRFFYSDDQSCRKLAERAGLVARPLPTHSLNLFVQPDVQEQDGETAAATAARRLPF